MKQKILFRNSFLSENTKGVIFLLLSVLLFVCVDACVKHVGQRLHIFEIIFFRCVIGIIIFLPYIAKKGLKLLKTKKIKLYFLRLFFGISNMMALFYAVTHLPLGFVTTVTLAYPIFIIIFASLILKEKPNFKRKIATLTGFIGIIIVVRPTLDISLAAIAALSCAILYSLTAIFIKQLSQTENKIAMLLWFLIVSSILTSFLMIPFWKMPNNEELFFLAGAACFGVLAQFFTIKAYEFGEATFVAPFSYFKILIAIIIGFIFFNEIPDIYTIVGAFIIIASSYIILDKKTNEVYENENRNTKGNQTTRG